MAYRWGITESGCDDDRDGDGRKEGGYNIQKARNKGESVLYILSAPAAAVVPTVTEAHLLVKELPEPAAVELREGDESRGIEGLDCLRKTTVRRDWKRQRNARNVNKEQLTRQTTTSSAPVLPRHRRVPPGGCP